MGFQSDPAVEEPSGTAVSVSTRAGYVTLVGRPNAGKSTLLNALVGEKLSIVTPRAQTTWRRVTGIASRDGVQMIFLDTPGLLEVRDLLQRSMLGAAHEAVREADVVLLLLDPTVAPDRHGEEALASVLDEVRAPVVAAVNKVDAVDEGAVERWETWVQDRLEPERVRRVSALRGTGIEGLESDLRALLPRSPYLYPAEQIASDPVRFFVAELVRETVFEQFRQEIPYSSFCRIEEYRESQDPLYIAATIFVERDSQKGILVGKGGHAIRTLGESAREKIQAFVNERVYLDLWVKVLPDWRRKRDQLRRFGFHVPDDDAVSQRD